MTEKQLTHPAGATGKVASVDTFLGWDQLILLAAPFPVLFVAKVAYILGLDSDTADSIRALYITPAFIVTFTTFAIVPVILIVVLLLLVGRNVFSRRPKRLVMFGFVLIVLPITISALDADYLRFVLQERKFKMLLAEKSSSMAKRSAYCFVVDRVQDNFYFGGANFAPFEKLILYVSEDAVGQQSPRIDNILSGRCPAPELVGHFRHLKGRFYLADTFHGS